MAGRWAVAVLALTCVVGCEAQETPSVSVVESPSQNKNTAKVPKGAVTGTVYCADTNAPARAATVMLVPAAGNGEKLNPFQTLAQTDLEGRFTMPKVPEGTYYVAAQFPGYRKSLPMQRNLAFKPLTEEEIKKLGSGVPKVTVAAKQTATVSIRLERGAEIDGTVLYDDGSPAVGLRVDVRQKSTTSDAESVEDQLASYAGDFGTPSQETDDHGRFRILGVERGEYVVGVTVPTNSADEQRGSLFAYAMESSPVGGLVVYAGDTTRKTKAQAIKIEGSDASKDADITIPLAKLHTIRGHVAFKSTGEAPPTAALELLYADNRELARFFLATDGEFAITYVPEGNYLLHAQGMKERLPTLEDAEGGDTGFAISTHSFIAGDPSKNGASDGVEAGAEIPVVVTGDVSGLSISVPGPPAVKAGPAPPPEGGAPNPASTPQ